MRGGATRAAAAGLRRPRRAQAAPVLPLAGRAPVATRRWTSAAPGLATAAHGTVGERSAHEVDQATLGAQAVQFVTAARGRGHPDKLGQHEFGEDAYFVSEDGNMLGVADGIASWKDQKIDSGKYSRLLMANCQAEAELLGQTETVVAPQTVLERGWRKSNTITGSSTACIATLDPWGTLRVANLGDSGFLVVRPGAAREEFGRAGLARPAPANSGGPPWSVMYRSHDMQNFFNCPEQLGPASAVRPARAELYTLPVQPGDLVILATDGLFDNLSETEICLIVKRLAAQLPGVFDGADGDSGLAAHLATHPGLGRSPELSNWLQDVADNLVDEAHVVGASKTARTPFGKECHRAGYIFEGGKLDDTMVVLGMVVSRPQGCSP